MKSKVTLKERQGHLERKAHSLGKLRKALGLGDAKVVADRCLGHGNVEGGPPGEDCLHLVQSIE